MPKRCSLCAHRKRRAIDAAIASGRSYRNIAERFGTSPAALNRHKGHVAAAIVKAAEQCGERLGDSLHEQMRELVGEARGLLKQAKREGDTRGAIAAVKATAEILDRLDSMLERAGVEGAGEVRIVVTYGDGKPFADRQPEPRPCPVLPVSDAEPKQADGEKSPDALPPVERVKPEKIAVDFERLVICD